MTKPPDVIGDALPDRSPGRRAVVGGVALVALVGAALTAYVVRDPGPDGGRVAGPAPRTATTIHGSSPAVDPSPTSTWLRSLPVGDPLTQLITVDDALVDPSSGTDRVVARVPFFGLTGVTTAAGIVLQGLVPRSPDSTEPPRAAHALIRRDGDRYLAGGVRVTGGPFALDADGSLAAYADDNDNGTVETADDRDVVGVRSFPRWEQVHYRELASRSLRVGGFVGDRVLLSSGDGAETAVLQWVPPGVPSAVDPQWSYVDATDPRGFAVIGDRDQCGHLLVARDGVPAWSEPGVCHRGAAFSADGTLLASVESPPGDDRGRLRVRRLPDRELVGEMDFPRLGDQQLTVVSDSEVLVVVEEPVAAHTAVHAVVRCRPAAARCEFAWRSDIPRDYGAVRVVRP